MTGRNCYLNAWQVDLQPAKIKKRSECKLLQELRLSRHIRRRPLPALAANEVVLMVDC